MAQEIWHRRDAVKMQEARQELYYWQYNNTRCFSNMLYELIAKADLMNQANLMRAFPEYVVVYREWQDAPEAAGYFKKHGLA